MVSLIRVSAACLVAVFFAPVAGAQFTIYTTQSPFATAAAAVGTGTVNTIDFESQSLGTLANGTAIGAVTFDSLATTNLSTNNTFSTTSGSRYLGSADAGNSGLIVAGDAIRFTFSSPVSAFGLYVLSADTVLANDFRLDAYQGATLTNTAGNSATPNHSLGGTNVFFLGFTNSSQSYTSVELNFDAAANGAFLYTADDVRYTPAPEPTTVLVACAFAAMAMATRRRMSI